MMYLCPFTALLNISDWLLFYFFFRGQKQEALIVGKAGNLGYVLRCICLLSI
jgi:hypothetical protein